jgi:hypothetical protein
MKTAFQLISEIKSNSKPYKLEPDDISNPFLVQRGLSMISAQICDLLNKTTNILHKSLDDQMNIDVWKMIIPKSGSYHQWIKKPEKDTTKIDNTAKIKEVARFLGRSEKTIRMYLEVDPQFLKRYVEK